MIKPLTSLRFLFAFMVFASHLKFLDNSQSKVSDWIFNSIFREGYLGVSFFFILSGFILAYNYQDKFIANQTPKKSFYIARFARIFPLHALTFIISLPLSYKIFTGSKTLWAARAFTNFSLTQSYIPLRKIYFSFNLPSWSISNEMFFYLAFPFLIFLIPKFRKRKALCAIAIAFIVPLLTFVIPEKFYHQIFYINPLVRIFDFIIGIIIFNIYQVCLKKQVKPNHNLLEISAVSLLVIFFIGHPWIPKVARYSFYYWIPMSYLIFSFAFQKGKISKLLSKNIFMHLGEISFGFYMFHYLILQYFLSLNNKFLHIESDLIISLIALSISLVVSHYSFILFENPMNKYVKKVFNYRKNTLM